MESLFSFLVCLRCHNPLEKKNNWLICHHCKIKYPIKEGIPYMIEEAITPLEDKE